MLELLTVIAILTLLIGILLPSLSGARRQAKANACLSTLRNLGSAFAVYLTENRDDFPPFRLKRLFPTAGEEYANEFGRRSPRWQWFLEMDQGPVIDPKPFRRLRRPWGDDGLGITGSRIGTTMTAGGFNCAALDDPEYESDVRNGAYGYNYEYLGNTRRDSNESRWDNFPVSLHQISSPAGTVLVGDSRGAGKPHGKHSYTLDPPRLATEKDAMRFGPGEDDVSEGLESSMYQYSPVEARHNNRGNVMFVDAHGEAKTLVELGYEIDDDLNVAVPVLAPAPGMKANNRLWTGRGRDELRERFREADGE